MTSQGLGSYFGDRLFWCFSIILDLQLPLDPLNCISLCVHIIFLCQLSCPIPVTDFFIGDGCLTCQLWQLRPHPPPPPLTLRRMVPHQLSFEEWTCAQLKICEALVANLFLQFGPPGSLSAKCGFDVQPPHSLGASEGGFFQCSIPFSTRKALNSSKMN